MDVQSAFLQSSGVLGIRHNRIFALIKEFNDVLLHAIERVAAVGEPETLICSGNAVCRRLVTRSCYNRIKIKVVAVQTSRAQLSV
jgi:hypothetical protein